MHGQQNIKICDIPVNYKFLHQLNSQFSYKIPCWSHDLTVSLDTTPVIHLITTPMNAHT